MARSRASAKKAGTAFESQVVAYLAKHYDDVIERRAKTGGKDRGDVSGFRFAGRRIVAEVKNVSRLNLSGWINEAEVERGNDDAAVGLVIHKRHGVGNPGDQYVSLTLRDLIALLTGERPAEQEKP